jgi:hypothetical protein
MKGLANEPDSPNILEQVSVRRSAVVIGGKVSIDFTLAPPEKVSYTINGIEVSCGCTQVKASSNQFLKGKSLDVRAVIAVDEPGLRNYQLLFHMTDVASKSSYVLPVQLAVRARLPYSTVPGVLEFTLKHDHDDAMPLGEFRVIQSEGLPWQSLVPESRFLKFQVRKVEGGGEEQGVLSKWVVKAFRHEESSWENVPSLAPITFRVQSGESTKHSFTKSAGFTREESLVVQPALIKAKRWGDILSFRVTAKNPEDVVRPDDVELVKVGVQDVVMKSTKTPDEDGGVIFQFSESKPQGRQFLSTLYIRTPGTDGPGTRVRVLYLER